MGGTVNLRNKSVAVAAAAAVLLLALAGCRSAGPATLEGYWEGKGKVNEVPLKDRFRQLTRKADYEFWFVVDKEGNATGEIELVYDAELTVENLPSFSAGSVSLSPKVGGKVTDLNPKRRFPLVGFVTPTEIALAIATPESERPKIEFTMRADPGVSAGLGGGAVTIPGGAAGVGDVIVKRIEMTPFTPFGAKAKVEKRPNGPYAARFEERGNNYAIEWSARQMGGEQRRVNLTPEMEEALRNLRQQFGR